MIARSIALVVLPLLTAGCAITGAFESSQHPQAATLTSFAKSAYPVQLVGFPDGENCAGGRLGFNGQKVLGFGKSTTVRIEPAEMFSFYFYTKKPRLMYYCVVPASFVPRAGASYVATFDLINFSVHFESDAVVPGTDPGIPPTDPSFGERVTRPTMRNLFLARPRSRRASCPLPGSKMAVASGSQHSSFAAGVRSSFLHPRRNVIDARTVFTAEDR